MDEFLPYDKVKEPYPEARAAGAKLIAEGKSAAGEKKTLIYVNNRLEGNALETIDSMVDGAVQASAVFANVLKMQVSDS